MDGHGLRLSVFTACLFLMGLIFTFLLLRHSSLTLELAGSPPPQEPSSSSATTILYWTKWFGENLYPLPKTRTCLAPDGGEGLQCIFTSDHAALPRAQGVIFHARDLELGRLPPRTPSALWIYHSEENPLFDHRSCGWYYRIKWWERQCDKVSLQEDMLSLFNLRMGYQLDSDIVAPYISPVIKNYTDRPLDPLATKKKNAIAWVANNCKSLSGREKYVEAIMKHFPVHSYGSCLNNMPGKDHFVSDEEVIAIISQYKFAFAWENAKCKDYVTEKLDHVFRAGVLPIVDGPDDYLPFIPNNHSVIYLQDFDGPKALADYLRRLSEDDELYLKYFDYKPPKSNYDPAFLAFDDGMDTECRICRKVVQSLASGQGLQQRVKLDSSCKSDWWFRKFYDDGTMSATIHRPWFEWGFGMDEYVLYGIALVLSVISVKLCSFLRSCIGPSNPIEGNNFV